VRRPFTGYAQSIERDIDLRQMYILGIDVVRRLTGRAVYDHEVTYGHSDCVPSDPRVTSGILAAYLTISQALIRGLSYLGISAELPPLRRGVLRPSNQASPVCFATPSSEVAVGTQNHR
jgi:lipoate-protein ligase A